MTMTWNLNLFLMALAFFHTSEFGLAAIFMRDELSLDSLLISKPYAAAMAAAIVEHLCWAWAWPKIHSLVYVAYAGTFMAIVGEVIRKAGMNQLTGANGLDSESGLGMNITASSKRAICCKELKQKMTAKGAFTHKIRARKRAQHKLVTHGIYRYIRHPGYLGWLLWAVGLQLLLVNPICTLLFSILVFKFFSQRVPYEEAILLHWFGNEWDQYKNVTWSGLVWLP